jgi:hypothetical protein
MHCDVTITDFIRTATLGDLKPGVPDSNMLDALGLPQDAGPTSRSKRCWIYKYGPLQIGTDRRALAAIYMYFDDRISELPYLRSILPRLADSLVALPKRSSQFIALLTAHNVPMTWVPELTFETQSGFESPAGVTLIFDERKVVHSATIDSKRARKPN